MIVGMTQVTHAKFKASDGYSQTRIPADCITNTFGFDLR
ncbi:unnamed protein product [uncultured bacterium]|nr:unnamed protein product [uncultured bacterium]